MGIRDVLKKKSNLEKSEADPATVSRLAAPEFTFVRSDTYTQEVIHPPQGADERDSFLAPKDRDNDRDTRSRLSLDVFRGNRSRSASVSSGLGQGSGSGGGGGSQRESRSRRLSQRLHLSRGPANSEVVPQDLPEIVTLTLNGREDAEGTESQWEKRATILARENEKHRGSHPSPSPSPSRPTSRRDEVPWQGPALDGASGGGGGGGSSGDDNPGAVSSKAIDESIQEAIRLHESGDLQQSTKLFAKLADPEGANNPLSQVLYGLALRHGWGCTPDTAAAVHYLSSAASNAATVENLALQAGLKKGGAAKGELVLAIFELANCFRHGWGIPKDAVAAKQYYETAANLGDTDAMNEVAWCYLEGFGTKKDKYAAAKYYRLAEQNGNKTLGNSWIWKDKYDPGYAKKK